MFEKEAEERARKLEESQTLGVYDNDEDLARDIAWDEGKVAGYEDGFKDGAEFGYNKAKEELKKENAELKEQCSILADCNTCHSTCKNENIEMKKQFTKAKEFIKRLHDIVCGKSGDDWELIEEVEQFISEVENDRNRKKSD